MGGGVFGLGAELNTTAASVALVGIILFTVLFEVMTVRLDTHLEGTPYKEMVDKIYRELTILGLISFGTFLFLQSKTAVDHDILIAFEFSHIVIFFAALFFVLSAVGMMYLNSRIKKEIDIASVLDTDILVKRFEENKESLTGWRIFFSQDAQKLKYDIRFKAYNMFFCDHYKFPVSAFDFSSYVREVLDKHVTKLLEVEISSWFFLCVLLCINIIRSEIVASSSGCDGDGDSDSDSDSDTSGRRFLASSTSSRCGGNDGLLFFMATGWAMLLSVCFLKLVAMRSESHLLKLMGCGNLELCIDYMKRVEKKLLAEEALLVELHKKRKGGDVDLKDEEEKTQTFKQLSFDGDGSAPKVGQVAVSAKRKAELLSALKAEPSSKHLHPKQNSEHQHHHQHHHDPVKDDAILGAIVAGVSTVGKVLAPTSLRNLSASGRRPSSSSNEHPFAVPGDSPKSTPHRAVSQYRSLVVPEGSPLPLENTPAMARLSHHRAAVQTNPDNDAINRVILNAKMKSVYLFKSEIVQEKLLDLALLFNCFYIAVFCANYAYVALEKYSNLGPLYFLLCLVPGFLSFYICGMCVKTHSILAAISHIDLEVIGAVVDETEDTLAVGKAAFAQVLEKLEIQGIDMKACNEIFKEFDLNGDGTLNPKELRSCLANLGVHLPAHKFKQLFRLVDVDRDGKISFLEFFLLLYPEETDNVEKLFFDFFLEANNDVAENN